MGYGEVERDVREALTLFENDTVLAALRLMQHYGLSELPVVDERAGELLGSVTEEELFHLWRKAPLTRMGDLLNARAGSDEPRARVSAEEEPIEAEWPMLRATALLH